MLMQARMKRCRTKPTSWIVGDIDQLPSAGPGQLLGLSRQWLPTSRMTEHWAATFVCNYRRSFRRKARPPTVRTSAFDARVARRDRLTRGLPPPSRCLAGRAKRKRPGNRDAPKFQPRSEPQAATLVGLTSRSLLSLVIGIARGFIASGISRTRSTCRSPFSRLTPLTLT
jgi:hypothetical protein